MLARTVLSLQKRWYLPLTVVLLLTILLGFQASQVSLEIRFDQFLPDSETVRAKDRLDTSFPTDEHVHYIIFSEKNARDDVLTPDSIREAHGLLEQVGSLKGVDEVQSIPHVYDNALRYIGLPSVSEAADSDITNLTLVFHRVLTEDDPEGFLRGTVGISSNQAGAILDDIDLAADVFLSSDFRTSGKAGSMIALVTLRSSLSGNERKALVREIIELSDGIAKKGIGSPSDPDPDTAAPFLLKHTGEDLALDQVDGEISRSKYILSVTALLFVSIVLYLSFRRFSRVLFPILTLGIAVIWTFGTARLLGFESSPLILVSIPLIVGLGVDFSIHLLNRYDEEMDGHGETDGRQERKPGDIRMDAMGITVSYVAKALIITAVTTVIAFLANAFSEVRPVMYFGLVCSIGIAYALVLTLFFLMPLTAVWDRWMNRFRLQRGTQEGSWKELKGSRTPFLIGRTMKNLARWVIRYPVLVLIAVVLVTTVGILTGTSVEKEFSEDDFISETLPAREVERLVETDYAASSMSRIYFLYEGQWPPGPELIHDIASKHLYIEDSPHVVTVGETARTEDIFTLINRAMETNTSLATRYEFTDTPPFRPAEGCSKDDIEGLLLYLADNDSAYSEIRGVSYSEELDRVFRRTDDGGYMTVITVYVDPDTWDEARAITGHMGKGLDEPGPGGTEVTLTGWTVMVVETVDSMERSQVWSTVTALALALLILLILYRSLRYSVIAVIPVLISATWILGAMSILSIPLNILTITVTSLTIGLGVDYSIHIIQRYREESRRHDPEKAMRRTLKYTGASISLSAFTTISGFMLLLASPLPVSRVFGLITALAVAFSFILSCLLVPVVLMKSIRKRTGSAKGATRDQR